MSWLLVEQGDNPSSDYFVKPWLANEPLRVCDLGASVDSMTAEPGLNLVFVRYLTPQWRRWVERHRASLGRLAFFMDDDLFDSDAHRELPLRYRWKLYRLARRHKAWLRRMNVELWVSTQWLAEKYCDWQPRVLAPQSPYAECLPQKTFFYHGSASHMQEIRWLLPVVEEVLQRDPAFSFELIGNAEIRTLFSHLPRVHVLQPMNWPAYKALVNRPGRIVGLAPLLPGAFNQARSATKVFDITQTGAVGIYADHAVYQSIVQHERNGLLLPMDQKAWANAIVRLGNDEALRAVLTSGRAPKVTV
jgi:hypothetical protein